jgi:opacity protein-like surface antigen
MKKAITIVVAAVLVSTVALAQDVQPVVKAGAKSLNFTFSGFGAFGLGAAGVNGGISGSYFLKEDAALRVGLQVAYNSSTIPWNGVAAGSDGSTSQFGVGVGVDYLAYMNALTPRVKPYVGAGIAFMTQSSDYKPASPNPVPVGNLTETKGGAGNDGTSFGVVGIVGAEFFLYPEISLSAEYQLNVFSMLSKADQVNSYQGASSTTTKQGSSTAILGFGSAGAGLHIYF